MTYGGARDERDETPQERLARGPFYLFAGQDYYPHGGIQDLKGIFASQADAEAVAMRACDPNEMAWDVMNWFQIVVMTSPKPTAVATSRPMDFEDDVPVVDARPKP